MPFLNTELIYRALQGHLELSKYMPDKQTPTVSLFAAEICNTVSNCGLERSLFQLDNIICNFALGERNRNAVAQSNVSDLRTHNFEDDDIAMHNRYMINHPKYAKNHSIKTPSRSRLSKAVKNNLDQDLLKLTSASSDDDIVNAVKKSFG